MPTATALTKVLDPEPVPVIALVRVDNRLIHGQVVEAWLPHLKVRKVVVADDEAAASPLIRAAMGLAVGDDVEVEILPLTGSDFSDVSGNSERTLLLIRDVQGVNQALAHGLRTSKVNLGNVHFGTGRKAVSPSVFLSVDELRLLEQMAEEGIEVEVRAVPQEKAVGFPEIVQKLRGR